MKKMIDELTGLKGIAALFVLFNHILLVTPILRKSCLNNFFGTSGLIGMSLFFILSGFVQVY